MVLHGFSRISSTICLCETPSLGSGSIHNAGVSVWPGACGGGSSIILVTYHCSIAARNAMETERFECPEEHSIAVIPPKFHH